MPSPPDVGEVVTVIMAREGRQHSTAQVRTITLAWPDGDVWALDEKSARHPPFAGENQGSGWTGPAWGWIELKVYQIAITAIEIAPYSTIRGTRRFSVPHFVARNLNPH